ncbi:hypothetical protein RUND412_004001 [Rhizina undulata]
MDSSLDHEVTDLPKFLHNLTLSLQLQRLTSVNQQTDTELGTVRFSKIPMSFDRFIAEIGATDALLDMLRETITKIKASHEANSGSYEHGKTPKDPYMHDLQTAVARGFSLAFRFRHILSSLEEDVLYTEMAMDLHAAEDKKVLVERAKDKLKQAIHAWENVESLYKNRLLFQIKTEILIIRPDASQEEIDRIIETQESKLLFRAIKRMTGASSSSIKASISARNAEIQELDTNLKELSDFLRHISQEVNMDSIIALGPPKYLNRLQKHSAGHRKPVSTDAEEMRVRISRRRKLILPGVLVAVLLITAVSIFAGVMVDKYENDLVL